MFSLEEKVGQMFLVGFEGLEPPPHILEWLAQGRIGGVILFSRNIQSPAQVARMVDLCHQAAKYPILVAIDQEGGDVARLRDGFTESPGAMALGAAPNGISLAESISYILATELRALGINWNFAPVVDLAHNQHNPAVGSRSPGTDKKLVARIAAAQAKGFQSGGVAACAKHFPGLGNTEIDTHVALPALDTPVEYLLNNDLEPYRAVITAGIASIMTTHTIYTTLDKEHPATVSPVVVKTMLREKLGYNGVVTTDCMEMKAVTDHYTPGESAVMAALAGLDLLLYSHTIPAQEGAYTGLLEAVKTGRVPESVIDTAVQRIQALKAKYVVKTPADLSMIRRPEHLAFTGAAARSGMVMLKNNALVFPLSPDTHLSVGVVEFASYLDSGIFETGGLTGFATLLKAKAPNFKTVPLKSTALDDAALAPALELAQTSDVTVLVTRNAHLMPDQLTSARKIMDTAQRVILLCMRNPYDAALLPGADAVVCTCGGSQPQMQAAVDALLGEFIPPGSLPVSLVSDLAS